jgi:hypothetical protein
MARELELAVAAADEDGELKEGADNFARGVGRHGSKL